MCDCVCYYHLRRLGSDGHLIASYNYYVGYETSGGSPIEPKAQVFGISVKRSDDSWVVVGQNPLSGGGRSVLYNENNTADLRQPVPGNHRDGSMRRFDAEDKRLWSTNYAITNDGGSPPGDGGGRPKSVLIRPDDGTIMEAGSLCQTDPDNGFPHNLQRWRADGQATNVQPLMSIVADFNLGFGGTGQSLRAYSTTTLIDGYVKLDSAGAELWKQTSQTAAGQFNSLGDVYCFQKDAGVWKFTKLNGSDGALLSRIATHIPSTVGAVIDVNQDNGDIAIATLDSVSTTPSTIRLFSSLHIETWTAAYGGLAHAVRITDDGDVLAVGERISKGGSPETFYTMRCYAKADGAVLWDFDHGAALRAVDTFASGEIMVGGDEVTVH